VSLELYWVPCKSQFNKLKSNYAVLKPNLIRLDVNFHEKHFCLETFSNDVYRLTKVQWSAILYPTRSSMSTVSTIFKVRNKLQIVASNLELGQWEIEEHLDTYNRFITFSHPFTFKRGYSNVRMNVCILRNFNIVISHWKIEILTIGLNVRQYISLFVDTVWHRLAIR